jgi:hypothetical protein
MLPTEQKPEEKKPQVRIFMDISSDPTYNNKVDIRGNHGVLTDVLRQVFEFPGNEDLAGLFDAAVEEYYVKFPEKRIINQN